MNNTFGKPIVPQNDEERLEELAYYVELNGLPDKYFTTIAKIIAETFDTPIALISMVAKEHVEFKGNAGMEGVNVVDRGMSLCSLAVLDPDPTIFEDALKEPCLLNNPLIAGEFGLRFYAGVPITTSKGNHIGTVCIVDKEPRSFSDKETDLLKQFAETIMKELKLRAAQKNEFLENAKKDEFNVFNKE
ncbi:MAG: ATPase [Bacteroidota bacterium]|jgi:GAF domain-containing protein|nr:ATPase [Bacteroidota bacterium]